MRMIYAIVGVYSQIDRFCQLRVCHCCCLVGTPNSNQSVGERASDLSSTFVVFVCFCCCPMSVLSPENPSTSLGLPRIPEYLETVRNASRSNVNETFDWFEKSSYLSYNNRLDTNETTSETSVIFFGSLAHRALQRFCKDVLFDSISHLGVRYWDLGIWTPNILFFLFLALRFGRLRRRVQQTQSPVFKCFFVLSENIKFSLEYHCCAYVYNIYVFADSRRCIRNAVIAIFILSSLHLALETILEFHLKLESNSKEDASDFNIYTHGGIGLWMVSSGLFAITYSLACLISNLCSRRTATLSVRCSFYAYCLILAIMNLTQMIGAALLFTDSLDGLCIVDFITFLYFTLYPPLVYFVFLYRPLSTDTGRGGGLLFSYRKQKDEVNGDIANVSIYYPHFSGLTSPSYDDLFDCDSLRRIRTCTDPDLFTNTDLSRSNEPYNIDMPLISQRTPESTVTTNVDYDYSPDNPSRTNDYIFPSKPSPYDVVTTSTPLSVTGPRQLKGLGPNGTLIFASEPSEVTKRL
uniref:RGS domain-containing protein n=1 Tax=Syphacia muris TaxID=451379 RepID=A0A158R4C7_9BILA